MNNDGKTCSDCAKMEYHEGDMYHSCRECGETFPTVLACAHYMGKITLPGPNEYEQGNKDDPRNDPKNRPLTSVIQWTFYDGDWNKLPKAGDRIIMDIAGMESQVFHWYQGCAMPVKTWWCKFPQPPEGERE